MKRLLLCLAVIVGTLPVTAQRYKSWYSSVTDKEYGVIAENIKGDNFDCMIYGQSLYKHIPIAGFRIAKKDVPAFVKELRSFAEQAGQWFEKQPPIAGIEDSGRQFKTSFNGVTAWYDMGTPPEPQYHNMANARMEAYSQMGEFTVGAVYLSVAPIVDKDGNRHPGVVLPFGSQNEIEAFITAVESLNPNVEEAYCAYCGANLTAGETHSAKCPYYHDSETNDSSPSSQITNHQSPITNHHIDIHITCPQCGAVFSGKSASLFFENPHNHRKDCPLFNKPIEVPQVPKL